MAGDTREEFVVAFNNTSRPRETESRFINRAGAGKTVSTCEVLRFGEQKKGGEREEEVGMRGRRISAMES